MTERKSREAEPTRGRARPKLMAQVKGAIHNLLRPLTDEDYLIAMTSLEEFCFIERENTIIRLRGHAPEGMPEDQEEV
jgi:hypothetical protein